MSDAAVIHAVFKEIFGGEANFFLNFDDRLKAQKIVYLLQELGVTCGDYSFRWYKRGPYSQQLQNTLLEPYVDGEQIRFSEVGLSAIEKIKTMLVIDHGTYSEGQWLETLGSIHYLKEYWYPTLTRERILSRLAELKSNLNEPSLNERAYNVLKQYSLLDR